MIRRLAAALTLALASFAAAQIPAPQVPLTGKIGAGGVFPLVNAGTLIMASDANRTMAYPETTALFIRVTSSVSLTATRSLVAPQALGFQFTIENATTGGQSLLVVGSSGAGVTIPNGQVATVTSDGTNYVTAAAGSASVAGLVNGDGTTITRTGSGTSSSPYIFTATASAGTPPFAGAGIPYATSTTQSGLATYAQIEALLATDPRPTYVEFGPGDGSNLPTPHAGSQAMVLLNGNLARVSSSGAASPLCTADGTVPGCSSSTGQALRLPSYDSSGALISQGGSFTDSTGNSLNGIFNAQTAATTATNGIGNLAAGVCAGAACNILVPPTYGAGEVNPFANVGCPNCTASVALMPNGTVIHDQRGGSDWYGVVNPTVGSTNGPRTFNPKVFTGYESRNADDFMALSPNSPLPIISGMGGTFVFTGKGNEVNLAHGKSTFLLDFLTGIFNSAGQLGGGGYNLFCFGNASDCNTQSNYITSAAGGGEGSGEFDHGTWDHIDQVTSVPVGTCLAGCTTGSTLVTTQLDKRFGQRRFLIDVSKVTSVGTLVGGTNGNFGNSPWPTSIHSGTSFTPSVFLQSVTGLTAPVASISPGVATVAIKAAPDYTGFVGTTSGIPSSGIACVADNSTTILMNYEKVAYTVVDGTHISASFYYPHPAGFGIAVGGNCGQVEEQVADTVGAIRHVLPVLGSLNSTTNLLASMQTTIGIRNASAFMNASCPVSQYSRTSGVATVITPNQYCTGVVSSDLAGLRVNVSGMTDTSFNATSVLLSVGVANTTLIYPSAGSDVAATATSSGAITYLTGAYKMYPAAEVRDVRGPATKDVDGVLTLEPNAVAWAAGDNLEQPVGSFANKGGQASYVRQYTPVLNGVTGNRSELYDATAWNAGSVAYFAHNAQPLTDYKGGGGTHEVPTAPYYSPAGDLWNWAYVGTLGKRGGIHFDPSPFCTVAALSYCTTSLFDLPSSQVIYTHDPTGANPDLYSLGGNASWKAESFIGNNFFGGNGTFNSVLPNADVTGHLGVSGKSYHDASVFLISASAIVALDYFGPGTSVIGSANAPFRDIFGISLYSSSLTSGNCVQAGPTSSSPLVSAGVPCIKALTTTGSGAASLASDGTLNVPTPTFSAHPGTASTAEQAPGSCAVYTASIAGLTSTMNIAVSANGDPGTGVTITPFFQSTGVGAARVCATTNTSNNFTINFLAQ